nr:O-antigen ligase family protein [Rhodoplanes tepidamans]
MTALCLVATFLTASRAGTMLTLLALGLAVLMVFRRRLAGVRPLLLAAAGLAAAAVLLLQVIGGSVGSRFDAHGLADAGRLSAWCSTLAIVAAHPWTGTGLGTFTTVFPAYRSTGISLWGVWNAAHSTPLELAAELGLPLAGAVVFGFAAILVVLARGSVVRRRDRAIPIAGLCVALLAGLHTTIDFSLQVPGCSIVVFGVIGIGLAQSFRSAAGR